MAFLEAAPFFTAWLFLIRFNYPLIQLFLDDKIIELLDSVSDALAVHLVFSVQVRSDHGVQSVPVSKEEKLHIGDDYKPFPFGIHHTQKARHALHPNDSRSQTSSAGY